MKVLLTGASGLVGSACRLAFAKHGMDIIPVSRPEAWNIVHSRRVIVRESADIFVHTAANTDVEQCEKDPDACYRDNHLLTEGLAYACALTRIPFVFISSTGVYGEGQSIPYREYSPTHPTTHHHRAKLLGEMAVIRASAMNLVLRTGWLFGGDFKNPKNFVARRLEEATSAAAKGQHLLSNSEQHGCPTYTVDLVDRMILLISGGWTGIFNVVNEGHASRLDYVRAIVEFARIPIQVAPTNALAFNRHARVSSNEMAVNWRARELGIPEMPSWRQSLERYVQGQDTPDQARFTG